MTKIPDPRYETIIALCEELNIRPLQRLKSAEVCEILGVSEVTLNRIRGSHSIAFLRIGERGIGFFGYQVAIYILDSVVETKTCPDTTQQKSPTELETIGFPNSQEAQHGVVPGTARKLSKQKELASARRIMTRPAID